MRILMLGWELPPIISGGLGVASQGIAEAIADLEHQVDFLLPKKQKKHTSRSLNLLDASRYIPDADYWSETSENIEKIKDTELGSMIVPYLPPEIFIKARTIKKHTVKKSELFQDLPLTGTYGDQLFNEIGKYALIATQVACANKYDLVHCHDWLTFKAGVLIKKLTGIPYVAHVHSTEKDRNGLFAHSHIQHEEKTGLSEAAHVFTVSERVKRSVCEGYGIAAAKITVIPNAVSLPVAKKKTTPSQKTTIAFIGRFTDQKSPATFIDIARDLKSKGKNYEYLMIGDGYLKDNLMDKARNLNLLNHIQFTGFLDRNELLKILPRIDLLIVPSVSEPFGLVMLEAILNQIPVLASTHTGLSEFIPSLPETDRWDIYNSAMMAEKLIEDKAFRKEMTEKCLSEGQALSWSRSAQTVQKVYKKLIK